MRFTQYSRSRLVDAIMADVPEIDYRAQMEARAERIGIEAMPDKVRAVWLDVATRHFITQPSFYVCCLTLRSPGLDRMDGQEILKKDAELMEAHRLHDEQRDSRKALKRQLALNVGSCSTRKQFIERFPELAKYAPTDPAVVETLPATTDLMDSLKAAGLAVESQPAS